MKLNMITFFAAAALCLGACDNDVESIDRRTVGPEEQHPELYARYLAALNDYKATDHYLVYARMDNAPAVSTSPKDFMKALPDSLDFIALKNPLSRFDREDLPRVHRKGTRVLAWADCSAAATAAEAVDRALAQIAENGLDGLAIAFYGTPDAAAQAAEAAIASKLAALDGKTLVFEGNAAYVAAERRDDYDLYVLDASQMNNVLTLREEVDYAVQRLGIPASKLLLATTPAGVIDDAQLHEQPALAEVARCVMAYGPLAGLGVFEISADYYSPTVNYPRTKAAISMLNPSYE